MSTRCYVPLVVVLLAGAEQTAKDDRPQDREKLQGEWAVVSWEGQGFSLDKDQAKKSKLVISGDEWQPTVDGKEAIKMKVKLDPTKTPKEVDFTLREKFGGQSDFSMKGIYKIEGDTLTVCRTMRPEFDRPMEFKFDERSVLIVFERVKKK